MIKRVVIVAAATLFISHAFFSSAVFAAVVSHDVAEHFRAEEEIDFLVKRGIIHGFSDGTFQGEKVVTKAQGAVMLVRALQLDTKGRPDPQFIDVSTNHWSYSEIAAAVDVGIFPKGKAFQPNEELTRASAAEAIANAFQLERKGAKQFSDVKSTVKIENSIAKVVENDIMSVNEDGNFKPFEPVTRAEFAVFLARALDSDYLPTQYNIPFNMNPVYNAFRFAIVNPEGGQDLFLPESHFSLADFADGVEVLEIEQLTEVARLNGVTEFSVTFTASLAENYKGTLVEGENQLFFLIKRLGFMDYKIVSVGAAPHLTGDDSISFTAQDARELFQAADHAYWHVVSGGSGTRDEATFIHDGTEYRYMAESFNTFEKVTDYLRAVYTLEHVEELISELRLIENNQKLAQPNADGGSLVNWEQASISATNDSTTARIYEMNVPLDGTEEIVMIKGELRFVPGIGWRVEKLR